MTGACIGIHAARPGGPAFEAIEPVRAIFGAYADGSATGLQARHDLGSQYVSDYSSRRDDPSLHVFALVLYRAALLAISA